MAMALGGPIYFPCKYSTNGCFIMLLQANKKRHEEKCDFRPLSCPIAPECNWHGSLNLAIPHIRTEHQSISTTPGNQIVFVMSEINRPGPLCWTMIQSFLNQNFILSVEKQAPDSGGNFLVDVQLVGPKYLADTFAYRLDLTADQCRLSWEATPRSIAEKVSSTTRFRFHNEYARLFGRDDILRMTVTIARRLNME